MKIAVSGATGRMGRMIIEAVLASTDTQLFAAVTAPGAAGIGQDAASFLGKTTGVTIGDDLSSITGADVLIDFTRPEATLSYLPFCVQHGIAMVIGTTGFDTEGRASIEAAAQKIPVVFAPNMSVAVNTAFCLIEKAAALLKDYDCEIVEMHHKHKVDAPSGTALEMGRRVAKAREQRFEDVAVLSREGHTGERKPGSIGFAALRGGDVVGDHTVIFAGVGERIEITHKSGSRASYAQGAVTAARFILKRKNGLFSMADVLGLS
ncbi:MAG: 4-hydroxy-tetrahydrodipicolinate reductase [Duodenibacillus sp.]